MKPLVKICGITNMQDALFCAQAGADMLGFIFYKKSPRYIEPSKAAGIIKLLPSTITPIGVFVNEQRDIIETIIKQTHLRGIQLSGDEPPEDCKDFAVPVWKVFRIRDLKEVDKTEQYNVSAVMLDGASDKEYGGSGKLSDFSIAKELKKYHPLVMSGGLNPENIFGVIQHIQPYAVDVNSGVEMTPGKKDLRKIKSLFEQLKG